MAWCNRVVFFPSDKVHTHYQSRWFSRIHSFGSISLCFPTMPKEMLARDKFTDPAGWEESQEIILPNILHWSRLKVSGHYPDVFIFTSKKSIFLGSNALPHFQTDNLTSCWNPLGEKKLILFRLSLNGHAKSLPCLHQSLPSCCSISQPFLF